jgi:predicted RecB family nuclease
MLENTIEFLHAFYTCCIQQKRYLYTTEKYFVSKRRHPGMTITAQDLYNYTKCAHRVYLDSNGDPGERREVSQFVKLLWEMGLQTEQEHLANLQDTPYRDLKSLSLEDARTHTAALMAEGAALIYQGVVGAGNWIGRPDLLVKRTDVGSRFGDYYYEAIDIKAGRARAEREGIKTKFKRHYAFQILFYRAILQQLQDYAPPVGRIINVDNEIEEFEVAEFDSEFTAAMSEVRQLVSGDQTSEPVLGSVCQQCEWYMKCRRWVEATQDPSGLFFVGKIKFDLKRVGLATVRDIAAMDIQEYLKGPKKIPRLGETTLKRMKTRAEVRLAGAPRIRPGYRFPAAAREIYFDIEDDPTRDLTYFYGLVIKEHGSEVGFSHYFARRPQEEEQTVRAFWEFLAAHDDAVYYVYSPKERSTLKRLMRRYDLDEAVFKRYVEQEFDLYTDLVVKYSDWPTYSYGIKQIANQVGFRWRDTDPSGANSIAWYNEYLSDPAREDLLQRLIEYNEDDCRAMIVIKDYFIACEANN